MQASWFEGNRAQEELGMHIPLHNPGVSKIEDRAVKIIP